MKNLIFFDNDFRTNLLPFTYTRPIAALKAGYLSIAEKWNHLLESQISFLTSDYLAPQFPANFSDANIYIAGNMLPDNYLITRINSLTNNTGLKYDGRILALNTDQKLNHPITFSDNIEWHELNHHKPQFIDELVDLQSCLKDEINRDISILHKGCQNASDNEMVFQSGEHPVWIAHGVKLGFCFLNTSDGPIYIGRNSEIMDGAMIKGPFILGENSLVKMGSKIYQNTAIGDNCKVAGEIQNSVIFGNSNKGHEGYLGNSVLGEWCNIGADSNNSNLKNNYEKVKLWSYKKEGFQQTGEQFVGLFMGDHSKCAINTMFNTGTVVGVSANIFSTGFPRNFIPSFSWGGSQGITTYTVEKAIQTAKVVYQRRNKSFGETEMNMFNHIFEESKKFRNWDK